MIGTLLLLQLTVHVSMKKMSCVETIVVLVLVVAAIQPRHWPNLRTLLNNKANNLSAGLNIRKVTFLQNDFVYISTKPLNM
jgi:hypothetical protein